MSSLRDFLFYVMMNNADTYRVLRVQNELPQDNKIVRTKLFYHIESEGYYGWFPEAIHTLENMVSLN